LLFCQKKSGGLFEKKTDSKMCLSMFFQKHMFCFSYLFFLFKKQV
jgi:hypothetical protein